jgi:hypothetical protein
MESVCQMLRTSPALNAQYMYFMLSQLTARQREIYYFLFRTIREKGYAPSIPEIGTGFKIASTNSKRFPSTKVQI